MPLIDDMFEDNVDFIFIENIFITIIQNIRELYNNVNNMADNTIRE